MNKGPGGQTMQIDNLHVLAKNIRSYHKLELFTLHLRSIMVPVMEGAFLPEQKKQHCLDVPYLFESPSPKLLKDAANMGFFPHKVKKDVTCKVRLFVSFGLGFGLRRVLLLFFSVFCFVWNF